MFEFKRYELVQEDGKFELILHLAPEQEEFGEEFFIKAGVKLESLRDSAGSYIKENLPNVKSATVKIVAGGILISTFYVHTKPVQAADFNMGYVFVGNTDTYIAEIDQTLGNVDVVAPDYFEINADGTLKISSKFDSRLISEMHNRNIKVVPYLSNNWDRTLGRSALGNREVLSTQLANFILSNNLDGINIDIENVTEVDRANYTDFVRLLRQKIGINKEVSVAVAANPSNWQTGWQGSYDYNALSVYADYLMIMAYDEHYLGGSAGPVASIGWVEDSIKYALKQQVPKEKIVLGIPFFGRYWRDGADVGGVGVQNKRIQTLIDRYNGSVTYDQVAQSPRANFTILPGDPVSTISGVSLQPGNYTFWYENDASIKAKIDLVHKYGLKGTGNWALGSENTSIWSSYFAWLSGGTTPVQSSPALDPLVSEVVVEPTATTVVTDFNTTPETAPVVTEPILSPYVEPVLPEITTDTTLTPLVTTVVGDTAVIQPTEPAPALPTVITKYDPTPASPPISPTAPPPLTDTPTVQHLKAPVRLLKIGSAGIDVKTLQTALKQKGYFFGIIDSKFGTRTKAAVISFQRSNGLIADGIASTKTYNKLFAATSSAKVSQASSSSIIATIKPHLTLSVGSKGSAVVNLQNKLKSLGFLPERVDGFFGTSTKNAVKSFQRKYGLNVDGIAGTKTIIKLNSL